MKSPPTTVELVFTAQPKAAGAGLLITPAIQVTARNASGETATEYNGEVRLTLGANSGAADLIGESTVAASAGVATFTNLRISQEGAGYTLVARTLSLSATSDVFDVAPEPAGQIAFVRSGHIFLMNSDGSGVTQLTTGPDDQVSPTWSPDGTKIAFVSSVHNAASAIYVMNADGSNVVKLTDDTRDASWPAWSPDGSRIVFDRWVGGGSEICVMNADGSDVRMLFPGEFALENVAPVWSPDGSKIAFLWFNYAWSNIYIMNADGSGASRFGSNQPFDYLVHAPAWSPDGRRMLFWSNWSQPGLTLADIDGPGAKKVSGSVATKAWTRAIWSSHGSRIVFEGATQTPDGSDLYIMKANGSETVRLTTDGVSSSPAWRPRPK